MHNYTKECPKCSSTDIRKGKQEGYANLIAGLFKSSKVNVYLCGKCGYIVDEFVEQPEKFKSANERNEL